MHHLFLVSTKFLLEKHCPFPWEGENLQFLGSSLVRPKWQRRREGVAILAAGLSFYLLYFTSCSFFLKNWNIVIYNVVLVSDVCVCVCARARACMCLPSHFSHIWLFVTLWTVACQSPLSIGFSRQEYWSGLLCPSPGNLPNPGIELSSPEAPALQVDSLKPSNWKSIHTRVCVCVCALFQILFCYRLLQDTEYSSRCYAVGPCCSSGLYITVCICQSPTPILSLPYLSPLVTISLSSMFMNLFLFCK